MRNLINELTTTVALTVAAVIGAVVFGTLLHSAIHHDASAQPTPTTASNVVPCLTFLSLRAMVLNQVDHIGPTPAASFCTVPR